jgi:hypothetical protein
MQSFRLYFRQVCAVQVVFVFAGAVTGQHFKNLAGTVTHNLRDHFGDMSTHGLAGFKILFQHLPRIYCSVKMPSVVASAFSAAVCWALFILPAGVHGITLTRLKTLVRE